MKYLSASGKCPHGIRVESIDTSVSHEHNLIVGIGSLYCVRCKYFYSLTESPNKGKWFVCCRYKEMTSLTAIPIHELFDPSRGDINA